MFIDLKTFSGSNCYFALEWQQTGYDDMLLLEV